MAHQDGGKGSDRRPGEGYQDGWARIFGKRTHFFIHDGWGQYHCKVCGKNEKYASHGERCFGEPAEVKL